ncbi:hypothetical protein CBS101457_005743 [Exobasidium rhododendri]|nr:hypothetical protein CBS101457_005743 [Exobasidium rhododendri]
MAAVKREAKKETEEEELFFNSDEEYEDDDEDEEEADDDVPLRQKVNVNMLKFGDVLSPPTPVRYSCEALTQMIDKNQVDLEPEYQRGVVWTTSKQSAVIDSIFRNCYVPPILFSIHVNKDSEGDMEETRICVDGKQRLSSIYAFMRNEIPIREPHSNKAFWFKPSRLKRYGLTEKQRDRFSQIQINCVEYRDLTEELERDMFQRVQMGVTLTPAEKVSANLGPWPDFFRELNKRFVENDKMNLRHVIKMARGKDFMYLGMISLLILHSKDRSFVPHSKVMTSFLNVSSKDLAPPTAQQRSTIITTLAKFTNLANDDANNLPLLPLRLPRRAAKPMAPIEFLFAAYICFVFPRANNEQLSKIIQGMMQRGRGEHSDLMLNTRVEKTLRTYIREMEAKYPAWLKEGTNTDAPSTDATTSKRAREVDSEDDEWQPRTDEIAAVRSRADYLS